MSTALPQPTRSVDVVVIGAGAAGMMCAWQAGLRGRRVLLLERNARAGMKILVSGGGRCNFTNRRVGAENFVSANAHFVRSALARFSPDDFLELVEKHEIPFHERLHGQLFCDRSAKDITAMFLAECQAAGVSLELEVELGEVQSTAGGFLVGTPQGTIRCESLVCATGGLSAPRVGATNFGYRLAKRFKLHCTPLTAGLVGLSFSGADHQRFADLSGIAHDAEVSVGRAVFRENVLFTHTGLSGPAILQASNYWEPGGALSIDLLPDVDLAELLLDAKRRGSNEAAASVVAQAGVPRRLALRLLPEKRPVSQSPDAELRGAAAAVQSWKLVPVGPESWERAEVTRGGIDTGQLSSRTMECRDVPGLYFIGELVDVTGWLGGFNFQWAWSSGFAAGQVV